MKHHVQPVRLNNLPAKTEASVVKSSALTAFRLLRAAIEHARTVPGVLSQAATDIQQAWEESSSPKP
jgi:hypothetical protein